MLQVNPLLLAMVAFLLLLVFAAVVILAGDKRRRATSARVAMVARGYGRRSSALQPVRPPANARRAAQAGSLSQRLLRLVALDPRAVAQHPVPWRLVLAGAALLGAVAAWQGFSLGGPIGLLSGPSTFVGVSRAAFMHGRRRYRARLYGQIPDALAMVVRAVRAGIPVVEAVRGVAREIPSPTRDEFSIVAAQIAVGQPLDSALWALAHRSGVPEYSFFAVALTLQAQTGGSLAETLDNLADVVRKRISIRVRGLALAAEARMSAAVLTGVPILTGAGLAVINPGYMSVLFDDPRGHQVLAAAAGLLGLGSYTIRLLIRRTLA